MLRTKVKQLLYRSLNVDQETIVRDLEFAFATWEISDIGTEKLASRSIDPEEQELKDYLLGLENWRDCEDRWLQQFQLPLMPEWAFKYLLPAILRFSMRGTSVDDVFISSLINRFSKLPKANQRIVLNIQPSWFSEVQSRSILNTLAHLKSEMADIPGRLPNHLENIISEFRREG